MDKELLMIALFCAQELRAAADDLGVYLHGSPADIEKELWLMAVDAGLDLKNLGEKPIPPPWPSDRAPTFWELKFCTK